MRTNLILLSLILFLASCAPIMIGHAARGVTKDFPTEKDGMNSAKMIVIRESVFQAGGKVVDVLLDGVSIARMVAGDHVIIPVEEGRRRIGIKGVKELEIEVQGGKTYYFEISNDPEKLYKEHFPFKFDLITANRGDALLAKTHDISNLQSRF